MSRFDELRRDSPVAARGGWDRFFSRTNTGETRRAILDGKLRLVFCVLKEEKSKNEGSEGILKARGKQDSFRIGFNRSIKFPKED